MSKASLVPQKAGALFVTIREELVEVCKLSPDAACSAAILHCFIHWQDFKENERIQAERESEIAERNDEPPVTVEAWFYISQADLKIELYQIWGDKKLADCTKWLIGAGLVKSRNNPRYRFDKTLQYQVQVETLNKLIESANLPSRKRKNAASKEQKSGVIDAKMQRGKRKNKDAISQDSTQDSTQNSEAHKSSSQNSLSLLIEREKLILLLAEFESFFGKFEPSDEQAKILVEAFDKLGFAEFSAMLSRCKTAGGKTWSYVLRAAENELRSSAGAGDSQASTGMSWRDFADDKTLTKEDLDNYEYPF